MSKNFNVDFKGIKEIDFEKYHSLKNSIQTVSSLNQENINYGEADGFDYESYLSSRATDDEIIEEYKQLLLISIHYKEKFNETIHSLEKEKINLENIYLTYQEGYNAYLYSGEESLSFDEYVTLTYGTDYGQLGMTEEEYKKRLQEINQDLNALKPSSYLLTQKISEIPYLALSETQRFQEYEKKKLDTSYDSLKEIVYKKVEEYRYKHYTEIEDVPTTVNMIVDSFRFEDIPDEDRIMCFYLLENKGIVAVYDYVSAIKDKLNRNAGEKEASEFIESISNNGEVGATVLTIAEGTKDGLDDFVDGIYNVFAADGIITQNQYAEIYKMLALEEKGLLKLNYTGGRLLGNAAPSLLVSFGASRIISSTAGALAGNSSRGLSVMGNARNLALINGHSELESIIYGGILGLSDTTTGYYLSGLPLEISDLKDLLGFLGTATNLAFDKLAKVGIKFTAVNAEREVLNDWVDTGLISSVSNSNVDLVDIPEEVRKDFFLGYTKGKMFLKESIIKFTFNYTDYRLSFSAIFDYMNNHHVSFEEALVNVNFMKD